MKLVVDTSLLVDYLRGGLIGDQLFDKLEEEKAELYIPTIVIYELFSGKSSDKLSVEQDINDFISRFKRIELTEEIAKKAGKLYKISGKQIGPQDYIIAASALVIEAKVLTLNTKHFEQISGLSLYPI